MWNWRGYQALRQNSGGHWRWNVQCRMQSIARACLQSVSRETSYVGLLVQPINDSGGDRGLCTTPFKRSGLSMPRIQYTASRIGSLAMLAENRATMTSRAKFSSRARAEKNEALEILDERDSRVRRAQEMENRSTDRCKHLTPPISHLHASINVTVRVARCFSSSGV